MAALTSVCVELSRRTTVASLLCAGRRTVATCSYVHLLTQTGGQDDLISCWSPTDGRIAARAQGHEAFVSAMAVDFQHGAGPSSSYRIVSVGEDGRVCYWDFDPHDVHTHHAARHRQSDAGVPRHFSQNVDDIFIPALPQSEVYELHPTISQRIPGTILTGLAVSPSALWWIHADGQLDQYQRPLSRMPGLASNGRMRG